MKFHQVQIGQRFLYRDHVYEKVSPVIARLEESGEQKFLRRADAVQPLATESLPSTETSLRKNIEIKKVSSLFDGFYNQCVASIEAELAALPGAHKEKVLAQLQKAAQQFTLELTGKRPRKGD